MVCVRNVEIQPSVHLSFLQGDRIVCVSSVQIQPSIHLSFCKGTASRALEALKFNHPSICLFPGDRIVSVTIAYDNIVYEDALTILSYASPYPVKVTVQKERAAGADPGMGSTEQLNHPLYRSQSLDALTRVGKEPAFRPKRTLSEMKSDTRKDSPRKGGGGGGERRMSKALSQTYPPSASSAGAGVGAFDVSSDVMVHATEMVVDGKVRQDGGGGGGGGGFTPAQEVMSAVRSEAVRSAPPTEAPESRGCKEEEEEEDPNSGAGRKKSRLDTEAAREFASLMDQMLDGPSQRSGDEETAESRKAAGGLATSPKTPPNKPQRKKKPSSSSSVSLDDPAEFFSAGGGGDGGVEETFLAATAAAAQVQASPNRWQQDLGPEVEEEAIQPSFVKRDIVIGSGTIEFAPVERQDEAERPPSPSWGFSGAKMMPSYKRPASPEGEDPVEEELIEAAVACRDAQAAAPLPSSAKSRGSSEGPSAAALKKEEERKRKKEKEKEKKPPLDEEELEQLIAMNAFPPGSQGWAGIKAGGKQGGIVDDFLPRDVALQALKGQQEAAAGHARGSGSSSNSSSSSSEASSQGQRSHHRAGVAFEVRDDVLTGRPVSIDISRSRNSSASPSRTGARDRMGRASSLRGDDDQDDDLQQQQQRQGDAEDKENREEALDWSGKRLVRSGSFPEIPQDDSISDWTDKNKLNNDDDDNSTTTSGKRSTADTNPESDSEVEAPRTLPDRDIFKARENLANMSDLSNSISSSRSSSPAVTNGPAEGVVGVLPVTGGSGVKNATIDLALSPSPPSAPTSDSNANSKTAIGITLNASTEDDMDC